MPPGCGPIPWSSASPSTIAAGWTWFAAWCPGPTRSTPSWRPPWPGSRAGCSATSDGSTSRWLGSWQAGADRHPALAETQDWLSRRYGVRFDGVALAHYHDGRDSVGWHRDRELRWLDDTVIGVLSLGARRPWLLRPMTVRRDGDDDLADAIDLAPASGDLLVMGGASQDGWLHAVPRTRGPSRSRISAQWRWTSRTAVPTSTPPTTPSPLPR